MNANAEAGQRHNEARKQRDLLLAGDSAFNSDFYYRYLASQGYLPGYKLPPIAAAGSPAGAPRSHWTRELPVAAALSGTQ